MANPELGRRDRKKLETYRSLRSSALRLVAERGLHQVTVEDIAEAADVSVRTFFNHFPSKEDAVIGLDPERVDELRQALESRPADEAPLAALLAVLAELAVTMVERSGEWRLRMEIVKASPALLPRVMASFATYERVMVEVIAARTGTDPDRDLYPALITGAAMGAFRVVMASWRSSNGTRELPQLLDAAFAQLAAGLPAPDAAPGASGQDLNSGRSEDATGAGATRPAPAAPSRRGGA